MLLRRKFTAMKLSSVSQRYLSTLDNAYIVLLSGGIESSGLYALCHERFPHNSIFPLFIHYGQANSLQEHKVAQLLCDRFKMSNQLTTLNLSDVGSAFQSMGGKKRHFVPLPHRNLVVLSMALSYIGQLRRSTSLEDQPGLTQR